MASIECKTCPKGQYVSPGRAPGKSPLDCLTCPRGTDTNAAAGYRACHCLPGYSRTARFGGCSKCTQRGFQCKRDYPELRKGFWMSWVNIKRCKVLFKSFMSNLDTKDDSYSRETSNFSCNLPIAHNCPMQGACKGGMEALCNNGYSGVFCAVCQSGYMKQFNKCVRCPSPVVSVIQCVGYFLTFIILCWLISKLDKVTLLGGKYENNERTFADLIQSSLKILMGFYQILVGIMNALSNIEWPSALNHAMKIFEFVQFSVLRIPSLHCIRSDWRLNAVHEFWISLIAMVIIPLVICIYFVIKYVVAYCCCSNESFARKCKDSLKNCLQAVVLFFFATYPFISTKIFHLLPASCHKFCTAEKSGQCLYEMSYLRNDYRIKCPNSNNVNNFNVKYAYVSLLLPIGLPCLLLYLLWKFAPKSSAARIKVEDMENEEASQDNSLLGLQNFANDGTDNSYPYLLVYESESIKNTSVAAVALKMTYGNYKESCWYWEFIEMIRKLLTNAASSFLLKNVKVGIFGNILLSIVFVVLHARKWPMKDIFDNYMQLLALVLVTVNLCYSATKTSSIRDTDIIDEGKDVFALGIMLVLFNSLLLIFIIGRFAKEIAMKVFSKLHQCECCCCCSCCSYCNCKENHFEQRININEQ